MHQMAGLIEMLKRSNYKIRDHAATSVASNACKSWTFPLTTNYKEFICLPERTRESSELENLRKLKGKEVESKNPAASNVKRTRKEKDVELKNSAAIRTLKGKGKVVEFKKPAAIRAPKVKGTTSRTRKEVEPTNPAGNGYNSNSINLTSDDDITLGEFLRRQKTLKVTKKRKVTFDVEQPRLSLPSSSAGLKPPSTVSKSVVEHGVSKKKHKTLNIEDRRRSLATVRPTGVLEPPSSKNKPVAVENEDRTLVVASEPRPIVPCGFEPVEEAQEQTVFLAEASSAFRPYKPVDGVERQKLFVPKPGPLISSGVAKCYVNQNPAELSTKASSKFMRS